MHIVLLFNQLQDPLVEALQPVVLHEPLPGFLIRYHKGLDYLVKSIIAFEKRVCCRAVEALLLEGAFHRQNLTQILGEDLRLTQSFNNRADGIFLEGQPDGWSIFPLLQDEDELAEPLQVGLQVGGGRRKIV